MHCGKQVQQQQQQQKAVVSRPLKAHTDLTIFKQHVVYQFSREHHYNNSTAPSCSLRRVLLLESARV
jgi:hypothetical protein